MERVGGGFLFDAGEEGRVQFCSSWRLFIRQFLRINCEAQAISSLSRGALVEEITALERGLRMPLAHLYLAAHL